ncbi:MAG: tetratricopeptide repeat protein [Bacteroidales bacterium]|nr:tetratricopeptide repeat protein [Bacteroidales bacterium]MCF6341594.1 tetratricopeptide repeat protein [Bacteroidales bacterium]
MKLKYLIVLAGLGIGMMSFSLYGATITKPQDDGSKYGKDSVNCVMNLSLYREFYKQWKGSGYKNSAINDAIVSWRKVYQTCPRASQNIYIDGVKMLHYLIKTAKDNDEKNAYIDTMMMVYDARIKYFPLKYKTDKSQVGSLLGRKGVDLYKLKPNNYLEAYTILKQSVDLEKENSAGPVFVYFFRAVTKMAQKGDTDTAAVVDTYDMLSDYLGLRIRRYMQEGNTKKEEEYRNIKGNIENTFEPFANCTDLVRIYQKKFDQAPDDVDLLKKISKILDKKKCNDAPLYFETIVELHKLDPSPESAYLIGKMLINQKRYKEAITYMEEACHMENLEKADDAYIYLAQTYRALDRLPESRKYALKAAEINPKWGEPWAFIGDLYAISASKCGDNDLTKKVAYWAAVDMYIKAKKVDPSITDEMNKKINTYSVYFPPTELLFFYGLTEGDTYTVGCWINRDTKIRPAK